MISPPAAGPARGGAGVLGAVDAALLQFRDEQIDDVVETVETVETVGG
ncbi:MULTISPECIES: hypothetical protein [Streptomyces]|nr:MULTISPECIES: hypothetical protein [Streptomyces]